MKHRLRLPVLLLALGLILAACGGGGGGGTPTPASYTVSGVVTDDGGQPIVGVTLTLSGPSIASQTTDTDEKGKWQATGLKGEVTATPAHSDYTFEPESRPVTKAATDVDFVGTLLPPTPYFVSGTVKNNAGVPLGGIEMQFSGGFAAVYTDAQGQWGSPELTRAVTVTPVDANYVFVPEARTVTVDDEADPIDFTGSKRTPVSGTVTDADNDPVPGVTLRIAYQGMEKEVTTDTQGRWGYADSLDEVTVTAIDPAYDFADSPRIVSSAANDVDFKGTLKNCNAGDVTEANDPCVITRIKQLQNINNNLNGHFALGGDIDASETETWNQGRGFDPIGGVTKIVLDHNPYEPMQPQGEGFSGSLDGRGYEIRGLYINMPDLNFDVDDPHNNYSSAGTAVGLFQWIAEDGFVHDISIVDGSITGQMLVGAVAGYNDGQIENVHNRNTSVQGPLVDGPDATFQDANFAGGLVGVNRGDILDAHNTADVRGLRRVGGIAAVNHGTIDDAENEGTIRGDDGLGGIAGSNLGEIRRPRNLGDVTGHDEFGSGVGGIVGGNDGLISDAENDGSVTGTDQIGGIAGAHWDGLIARPRNAGDVQGNNKVGGIAGLARLGRIEDPSNTGKVTGIGSDVGEIVGSQE